MPSPNPLTSPPPSSSSHSPWGPYSNAKEFDANMATILIILVLATILAFALHAAIRFFLRLYRLQRQPSSPEKQQDAASLDDALPSLVFSPGTRLAGGEGTECAICLTEFVAGDRVRVLPACNHGFHVKCVEGWLASRSSCPTCRRSCQPAAEPPEEP